MATSPPPKSPEVSGGIELDTTKPTTPLPDSPPPSSPPPSSPPPSPPPPSPPTKRSDTWYVCVSPNKSAVPATKRDLLAAHRPSAPLVYHPRASSWQLLEEALAECEAFDKALVHRPRPPPLTSNLRAGISVKYDPLTGGLSGLPAAWAGLLPPSCVRLDEDELALPLELRPAALPLGVKLSDEPIVGRPYNVRTWRSALGIPLELCDMTSWHPPNGYNLGLCEVPTAIETLRLALLECDGLREEGIFRLTPDASICTRATEDLNRNLAAAPSSDPHVLAFLIKQWFRALPSPLFSVIPLSDMVEGEGEPSILSINQRLSPQRQALLLWLLDLASEVRRHEEVNRMSLEAIGTVMTPNLIDLPECADDPMSLVNISRQAAKFVIGLLRDYESVRDTPRVSRRCFCSGSTV